MSIDVSRLAGHFLNRLDDLDKFITRGLSNPLAGAQAHALVQELRVECERVIEGGSDREFAASLGGEPVVVDLDGMRPKGKRK